jgi:hypothetical protein
MTAWILFQILLNLMVLTVVSVLWFRSLRPNKDDPRMSRGLQLLQSKIAVLEDLIDRTDNQGQALLSMMESKTSELKIKIKEAEEELKKIEDSRQKNLEVARIFQDKIPHDDILQMQKSQKYVKAARLANAGVSLKDIAKQVDLTMGELEFISTVNKDELQFSDHELPDWIEKSPAVQTDRPQVSAHKTDSQQLADLGNKFRQAMTTHPSQAMVSTPAATLPQAQNTGHGQLQTSKNSPLSGPSQNNADAEQSGVVKRVVFPKIQSGSYR